MNGASPALPVWIVPDADLKENGGQYYVEGRAAIPITGNITPPSGSVTAVMINSEAAGNGAVLTANGSGGAAWIIPAFLTQAQGDVRYGQLAALNTWALAQTFTGQVLAAAGTVGAPSLSFTLDSNTGIYNTPDVILFSTGGVERAQLSSANFQIAQRLIATQTTALDVTATLLADWRHNSSNAPSAGFGAYHLTRLKSATVSNTDAVTEWVYWITAIHASRVAAWGIKTTYNANDPTAAATAFTIGARRTGAAGSTGFWLISEDSTTLRQVMLEVSAGGKRTLYVNE